MITAPRRCADRATRKLRHGNQPLTSRPEARAFQELGRGPAGVAVPGPGRCHLFSPGAPTQERDRGVRNAKTHSVRRPATYGRSQINPFGAAPTVRDGTPRRTERRLGARLSRARCSADPGLAGRRPAACFMHRRRQTSMRGSSRIAHATSDLTWVRSGHRKIGKFAGLGPSSAPGLDCRAPSLDHGVRAVSPWPTVSLARSSPMTGPRIGGASGAVNRLLRRESVRHMSVSTATRGLTAAHHETSGTTTRRPARPGTTSSRAIFAGGGRCWVRTSVG